MGDDKKRVAYWSDTKSNLLINPPVKFGDPVTDILTEERKEFLAKRGKVTFEPIEEELKADVAKTNALEKSLKEAEKRIEDLERDKASVPKNVTNARKEIKVLKSELVEKDIELDSARTELSEAKKNAVPPAELEALKTELLKYETVKTELSDLKNAEPKPDGKAAEEIAKLEELAIDWELKVDHLTEMVNEMAKTWKAPKSKESKS